MLLLPSERDLPPAEVGLRLVTREAAMRRGVPYALVGAEEVEPGILPWYVWVGVGAGVAGVLYLILRPRPARDVGYVLVDRDQPSGEAGCTPPAPSPLNELSSDEELIAAFDRDALSRWSPGRGM